SSLRAVAPETPGPSAPSPGHRPPGSLEVLALHSNPGSLVIRARVRESATRSVGDAWLASAGATSCDQGVRASSTPKTEADGTLTLVFPRGPAEQLLQT